MADQLLMRRDGESELAYCRRIINGKLVDGTLADYDYSELAELVLGRQYESSNARKMMYGCKRILDIIEKERESKIEDVGLLSELDSKMIDLQKERQKFSDMRVAYNKLLRERSRQEEINDILRDALESGEIPELNYQPSPVFTSDTDLLCSLNDIHYGAVVDNYWNVYNSEVCRQMMNRYLDKIISVAELHRSENCYVWCNGDEISGNIHYSIAVSNKENVIQQIKGVSELISQFLAELSKHFHKVYFVSVSGNHSRINSNKDLALQEERLDDLVEWYAEARLQNFDNIHILSDARIDPTMYLIKVRGKKYLGVHGDVGNDAKSIQSLQTLVGENIYAVLSGHMHHCKTDTVQGVKMIMAGSFLGTDEYCVQKRIYGEPEQMILVCDASGIRCQYEVPLKVKALCD